MLWLAGVPGWGGRMGVPWAGARPWPVPLPVELSRPPRRGSGVIVSGVPDSRVAVARDHPGAPGARLFHLGTRPPGRPFRSPFRFYCRDTPKTLRRVEAISGHKVIVLPHLSHLPRRP